MRKILIYILLFSLNGFAQETNENEKSLLPNVNPPSPESFAITEYGKNTFNDFRGKASVSIPLYNYKAGQLELPITIGHNGSGVKVNDLPTWTGINWTLNIGNVINRTVNDGADENYTGIYRVYSEETALLNATASNCATGAEFYYDITLLENQYDSEVDIFNFSAGQYSGSFYLDANFNPILINNEHELKITIDGSLYINKRFIITTPEGIKYFFGGDEVEYTRVISGSRKDANNDPTTFYLYKIEHPVKGTILIEYETLTSYRSSKLSKNFTSKIPYFHLAGSQVFPTFDYSYFITETINPKYLSKIKSLDNQEEVVFNSNTIESDNSNNHFRNFNKVLNNISVKNSNSIIKTIDFNYLYGSNGISETNPNSNTQRFFLTEVQINNSLDISGNKHEVYKMEYNDALGLPDRLTNGQDIEGFYNGQDNNTTLIPPLEDTGYSFASNEIFANRHPNFFYSSKGVLTKIYYPTGGFTEFEYESTPARKKIYTSVGGDVHINCDLEEESPLLTPPANYVASEYPTKMYDEYPKTVTTEELGVQTIFPHPIFVNQTVSINLSVNTVGNIPTTQRASIEMKIINLTNNTIPIETQITHTKSNFDYHFLANNNYKIELRLIEPLQHNATYKAMGGFNFKLHTGYQQIDGFDIRLKRQKDFASTNELANNTRYYYKPIIGTEPSTETVLSPRFDFVFAGNLGTGPEDIDNSYYLLQSEDRNKYCLPQNSDKGFSIVTTSYGGDNFEKGGVERYFSFMNNKDIERINTINNGYMSWFGSCESMSFMASQFNTTISKALREAVSYEVTDNSTYNGTLVLERVFMKKNGNLFKAKETSYDYSFTETNRATNLVTKKISSLTSWSSGGFHCSSDCSDDEKNAIYACYLGYYSVKSVQKKLNAATTKEYIDGISMNDYMVYPNPFDDTPDNEVDFNSIIQYIESIEAPYKKIVSTEAYSYGTYKGLPTEITTTTSQSNVVNKMVNTYVNTASSLSSIPMDQNALYNTLIAQNRISTPIQTQQFTNAELISTQRTLYKNFNLNGIYKILPEKIQTSKGNLSITPLEDKAIFYNYDSHFNPVVMGYADGLKTRYIFNSDGLVVAKIENYTGTDTSFPVVVGNIDNTNCALQNQYSDALVTVYTYNLISKKLIKITNPNCINSFYEYDNMWRLKAIKDHDGNILQEFDNNYKPQN